MKIGESVKGMEKSMEMKKHKQESLGVIQDMILSQLGNKHVMESANVIRLMREFLSQIVPESILHLGRREEIASSANIHK